MEICSPQDSNQTISRNSVVFSSAKTMAKTIASHLLLQAHNLLAIIYKQKMFWFRNLQERTGLIDKRKIRRIWNSYTDKYMIKRFFRF